MSLYVVDASVAVEYLLRTPLGLSIAETIEDARLAAPDLIDAEVVSGLRRAVHAGRLTDERAVMAIDALTQWPLRRIAGRALAPMAWPHHHNITAYDAFYVAAASALGAPLLTADGRLARAPGLGITIQHIRIS
ncbi:MAG: type II toxin-antitoxin system VapC family toxin [Acidimicrobiaceae bacterium]|nr:type II toxin-antitoxin system VapC family toxin [Acidimicrobiaceae bacterium]